MGLVTHYTNTQIARVRQMADEGSSSYEIAKALNRPQGGIQKLCKRLGIKLQRRNQLSRDEVEEIYRLHIKGVPRVEIALQFGITATKVRETAHREHKRLKGINTNPELNPLMSKLLSIRWVPEEDESGY